MAKWMSCKGVGSRFSTLVHGTASKRGGLSRSVALTLLVASTLAAGAGCSTSGSEALSAQPAAIAEQGSGEPEQVVQRMAPEPASGASSVAHNPVADTHVADQRAGDPRSAAGSRVDARLSAAGVRRADSRPSSAGEPITSKHLEAELNRLEAELGN
jgi:hypothetical protein